MKKQELIHLHALLEEVADHISYEEDGLDLTKYEELGVHPLDIHRKRPEHENAVFSLTYAITENVDYRESAEPYEEAEDNTYLEQLSEYGDD